MPELGPYGSVRGARGNSRPYRESGRPTAKPTRLTTTDSSKSFAYRELGRVETEGTYLPYESSCGRLVFIQTNGLPESGCY